MSGILPPAVEPSKCRLAGACPGAERNHFSGQSSVGETGEVTVLVYFQALS